MKNPLPGRAPRGFSLIELLVVLAVMLVLLTLGMPSLQNSLRQSKMRGIASEISVLMRVARLDAIKTSSQAVVQIVLPAGTDPGRVQAFSDRNADGQWSAGEPVLGTVTLPTGVTFENHDGMLGKDSVKGFSPDPAGGPNMAIFLPAGSIDPPGGFYFADTYEHYMEVYVERTARVEVLKYEAGISDYVSNGGNDNNGKAWTWD